MNDQWKGSTTDRKNVYPLGTEIRRDHANDICIQPRTANVCILFAFWTHDFLVLLDKQQMQYDIQLIQPEHL